MTLDVAPMSPPTAIADCEMPTGRDRLGLFLVAVAAIFALAGALILVGLHAAETGDLVCLTERDNVAVGHALANLLVEDRGLSDLAAGDTLPTGTYGLLHRVVATVTGQTPFIHTKLVSINGRTIFDSDNVGLGEDKTAHFHYQEAHHGRVASKLVFPDAFEDPALRDVSSGYVATYIPFDGASGTGVLELYHDVTAQLRALDRTMRAQALLIGCGLLAAFAATALVAGRFRATMRREQAARLASARAAAGLAAANAAKVRFLANMSHELRTPLTAIIGFSEILKTEQFGPLGLRYRDYAGSIHASGVHLLNVVDDVLETTRIEAGRVDLRIAEVDLRNLICDVVVILAEQAERAQLTVSTDVDPAIGVIRTDASKLKQVLLNLISNAVKFTYAGGSIRLSAERLGSGIRLVVGDTGIGIRPEDIAIALTPFGQIDNPFARRHQGTGLGLPLARNLVDVLGGRFEIASEPGRGTVVTVTLPVDATAPRAAA